MALVAIRNMAPNSRRSRFGAVNASNPARVFERY
jgi:hypothetical protein